MKDIYRNFLQNGVRQKDGSYEFTVEQLYKVYDNLCDATEKAKRDYELNVKELRNFDYRIFAARNTIKTCKEASRNNTIEKLKSPLPMSMMIETAGKELGKAIKGKKNLEYTHINFTKPTYHSLRFETDRMRNVLSWIRGQVRLFGAERNIEMDSWKYRYEFARTLKVKFCISGFESDTSIFVSISNMNGETVCLSNRF